MSRWTPRSRIRFVPHSTVNFVISCHSHGLCLCARPWVCDSGRGSQNQRCRGTMIRIIFVQSGCNALAPNSNHTELNVPAKTVEMNENIVRS